VFERFTERAGRILFFARYEASQFGSPSIDTEHLLLGLLREGHGLMARVFANWHLSFEEMRRRIESSIEHRGKISTSIEMPFTLDAKRVLEYAIQEADRLASREVGSAQLLIGILRVEHSLPARLMTEVGMTVDSLRELIATMGVPAHSVSVVAVDVETLSDTIAQLQLECAELRGRVEILERELRGNTGTDPS
jgi:ATP-dependent Clp protease ATP-binding subunit ClpC